MFMSTDAYLKRIMLALDRGIAPKIESDALRGQVYAVVDLLNQLTGRIEYKRELLDQEIRTGAEILEKILTGLESEGISAPDDLAAFVKELGENSAGSGPGLGREVEERICRAIDVFHAQKDKMSAEQKIALDQAIRDYILKAATRDLGLTKPPNIDKISRSKYQPASPGKEARHDTGS